MQFAFLSLPVSPIKNYNYKLLNSELSTPEIGGCYQLKSFVVPLIYFRFILVFQDTLKLYLFWLKI